MAAVDRARPADRAAAARARVQTVLIQPFQGPQILAAAVAAAAVRYFRAVKLVLMAVLAL